MVFICALKVPKMPVENMEEQGLEKNPKLEIAQWIFNMTLPSMKNNATLKNKIMDAIKEDCKRHY